MSPHSSTPIHRHKNTYIRVYRKHVYIRTQTYIQSYAYHKHDDIFSREWLFSQMIAPNSARAHAHAWAPVLERHLKAGRSEALSGHAVELACFCVEAHTRGQRGAYSEPHACLRIPHTPLLTSYVTEDSVRHRGLATSPRTRYVTEDSLRHRGLATSPRTRYVTEDSLRHRGLAGQGGGQCVLLENVCVSRCSRRPLEHVKHRAKRRTRTEACVHSHITHAYSHTYLPTYACVFIACVNMESTYTCMQS
jgi:hypothetical protein